MAKWFGRKKKPVVSGGAGHQPFAFTRKGSVMQKHRVKVRVERGFRVPEPQGNGVGEQVRALMVVFALSLLMGTMAVRLAYVAVMPPAEPRASIREMPVEPLRRGDIYDRNGVLLATTLKTYSLYADPKRILSVDEVAKKLPTVLTDMRAARLKEALSDPARRFVWLKRRMTPAEAQAVHGLGLPGLSFREEYVRVYPMGNLGSHILGAVDIDNNGLAGVERSENERLRRGERLDLALDVRTQELLHNSVEEAVDASKAKAGVGVVMDAMTGEILAMVSLPDYDPNHFGAYPDEARFNRAVLGSYEMGSTFKIFTLAQGLDEGKITPDTQIDCREPIRIGKYTIKDYHAKKSILTATEVLRYSSNIGAAHIADMSGPEAQKAFMGSLGMLKPVNVGLAEVGPVRYPTPWGRIQTFTIAFGHGIMVTPMHLVAAVGALANDGHYRRPHVLKGGTAEAPVAVLKPHTVEQLRDLMRDVVTAGSGRNAQVVGYDIGGKTGTAEKIGARGYDKSKNIASFLASMPAANPRYITLIMMDEPDHAHNTGGLASAPAVGAFLRRVGLVEGIEPNMQSVEAYKLALERKLNRGQNRPKVGMAALPVAAPNDADTNEAMGAHDDNNAAGGPAEDLTGVR